MISWKPSAISGITFRIWTIRGSAKIGKTQDAVVRNLEVIGEAASRLPDSTRSAAGGIEWRKIIGLRNILAHEYFGISLPVIWDLTQKKLDPLAKACSKLRDNPDNF